MAHTISLLEGVRHHVLSRLAGRQSGASDQLRPIPGTVRDVHTIAAELEEPFCFYLIAFDNGQRKEPIWFDYSEVELISRFIPKFTFRSLMTAC